MARTSSTMLPLGTPAPVFALPDVMTGKTVALSDFSEKKALLVIFLCNHCPYVIHVREELARIARDYAAQSFGIVGITSNDITDYPQDSPEATRETAQIVGFPILYDATQTVAKAYTAACTPDFFLFGSDSASAPSSAAKRPLLYRGQLDNTRPRQDAPTGADLRTAIDAVLAGTPVSEEQRPSLGCNIKWKPGNAPEYFNLQ